jgi:hypothetical protein
LLRAEPDGERRPHEALTQRRRQAPGPGAPISGRSFPRAVCDYVFMQFAGQARLTGELTVPTSATTFVGRDDELATVSGMLTGGGLVSVVGPPGCGKTRLALEAGHRWPGEARLAVLSAAAPGEVRALITAVLDLGSEADDPVAAARLALAGTSLLLIVDNCEHATGPVGEVLGALASSVPGLRILATSREPLPAGAGQVLLLRPLPTPTGPLPQDVRSCAAGQLFLRRALAATPGFHLDEAAAPHVAAICFRLEGLPLAIELAAAQVAAVPIAELADGLDLHLDGPQRPGSGRPGALWSAIEWSYQLLEPAERDLLRRLAVLPGEFTLPLAAAIGAGPADAGPADAGPADAGPADAGPADAGPADAGPANAEPGPAVATASAGLRRLLARLVERSLVCQWQPGDRPETTRYWLHHSIQEFALAQPSPAGEQVARAHARFYCNAAESAARAASHAAEAGPGGPGLDEPNVLAALAWSAGHDPELASRLLIAVCQLSVPEPSGQALELIREVTAGGRGRWGSEALARASMIVSTLSPDDAERLAAASAKVAASERDQAFAGCASGWAHARGHAEREAVLALDPVIAYALRVPDPWLAGSALQARGLARGALAETFTDWEEAVARFTAAGDPASASDVRYMLASRAVDTRSHLAGVPGWLDACEPHAASRGHYRELAHIRRVRGSYQRIRGDPGAAWQQLEMALPVFRHAGDFRCTCRVLFELAQLALAGDDAAGDPAVAADLLLQCLGAAAAAGDPAVPARVLADLVTTAAAAGDLVLAARCLGALEAVRDQARLGTGRAVPAPATEPGLASTLAQPGYAAFVSEGRDGGIGLITTLYPRLVPDSASALDHWAGHPRPASRRLRADLHPAALAG